MINNHKMLRNDGNVIRLKISSNIHVKSMTQVVHKNPTNRYI